MKILLIAGFALYCLVIIAAVFGLFAEALPIAFLSGSCLAFGWAIWISKA